MDKLRRIVTGIDKNGQAIFESDEIPDVTFTMDEWPGFNNVELWQTENPLPNLNDEYNKNRKYDFNIPPGIVRFCTMRLPPLKSLIAHQRSIHKDVDIKNFGMHRTDTIDYLILLEGEVTLILEDGKEKTLKVGDTVVQKGNIHTWHNRGEVDCIMACIMIGAKTL